MSALGFLLIGWWLGILCWCLGLCCKLTIIGWPLGEMFDDLAHQAWTI